MYLLDQHIPSLTASSQGNVVKYLPITKKYKYKHIIKPFYVIPESAEKPL